ncbi:stress responsive A/B barrel domain protein [Hypomontagnella monticulosa]|nr:stress responsive A/B barrel domain protein [Hypomontagnella monticulosa]
MSLVHIVAFKFKDLVPAEEVKAACDRMLALGTNCIHPTSQKTYIKVIGGGRDNSPEGMQHGMTHSFVFQFESVEDRDYYVKKDPAHLEFVSTIKDLVEDAHVMDFIPGVF